MEQAEELLRCHDPAGALERFDAALARDPGDVVAVSGRIRTLWALRRAAEARDALADAIATHERGPELLAAQGTVALGLREHPIHVGIHAGTQRRDDEAAAAAFGAALELDPGNGPALRGLATAYRLAGRADDARTLVETTLRERGPSPGLLVESAWCAFESWDLRAAFDALDTALRAWPDDLEASLAKAYLLRMDDREAEETVLLTELRQHVVTPCPALEVEQGSHAYGRWSTLAREQVPPRDDEAALQALVDEAWGCFERALESIPDLPAALDGQVCLAGFAGHRDPEIPPDAPVSANVLDSRADLQAYQGATEAALENYALAHSLDPHLLGPLGGQVGCLWILGRRLEARRAAEAALALCPRHPWLLLQLALVELGEEHYERAFQLCSEMGSYGTRGDGAAVLVASLRMLDCADTAEELAEAALEHRPRDMNLLLEYAGCAADQGRYDTAIARYDRALDVEPGNADALEQKKQVRRLARHPFRWLRPPLAAQPTGTAEDTDRAARIAELLPEDAPLRLSGRLRALGRRRAAIAGWGSKLSDAGDAVAGFLVLGLYCAWWLLLSPFGGRITLLNSGLLVAADTAAFALITWLVLYVEQPIRFRVMVICGVVSVSALGVVVWRGHGHPAAAALIPALALCFACLSWVLPLGMSFVARIPVKLAESQLRSRDPFTHLVNDLIDLLALLEYEPALGDPAVRRQALDLIERVARGQERVLVEPLGPQGRRSTIEEATGRAFRHHVAGAGAATRDLKRSVLSPGPDTWPALRSHVAAILNDTVHARWDQLPHRQPDPVAQVLRVRLLATLRSLLVLLVPPALVITLQGTGVLLPAIPTEVQVIAYIGWPAIVLLLWLDPSLAKKVDALKGAADVVRSSFSK